MPRVEKFFRDLMPRGLLGRSLLIILLPLLIVQVIALQIFYGSHLDVISRRLAAALAGELSLVVELLQRDPSPENRAWVFREAAWRLDMALAFEPQATLGQTPDRVASLPLLPLEYDLARAMAERVARPFDADWTSDPRSVIIRIQLPDGVLHVEAPRKRLFNATLYLFMIWLVGSALLLFTIAALFMKNQVRAIRRLAGAAEAFGLGRDTGQIKPEGAAEVRQAAQAFNRMQERIRRFVAQRTDMLAGISHDLRTPLTRMRLGLAMLPHDPAAEADVAAITQDVEEMERMVAAYLAFARGEGGEQPRAADLAAIVRDVAQKARRDGAEVAVDTPPALMLQLRPDALRRCLANLLDNARKHARRIAVAVSEVPREVAPCGRPAGGWAQVTVDDDGPGIPAAQREEAFRPFATLSAGGTGLGLAIARDIARAHGGDIVLEESPLGGLRARVRLPV
ncbi:MAG: hypothetical protein RLZZ187_2634 [Pseudomonadota bacterium]|jgi:two-component system osmolarity sensor histidine kinase EnvZ